MDPQQWSRACKHPWCGSSAARAQYDQVYQSPFACGTLLPDEVYGQQRRVGEREGLHDLGFAVLHMRQMWLLNPLPLLDAAVVVQSMI